MFIKLFLIGIILYIIINQFTDNKLLLNDKVQSTLIQEEPPIIHSSPIIVQPNLMQTNQSTRLQQNITPVEKMSEYKVQEFDQPQPWTKVIFVEGDEYPYYFHFRVVIPSLNDFERWKQIIPNIDFNPNTRELIIPCKEEASALAIANLICINFSGQMTIENILEKDLIRISIYKAKTHEVVRNKLREQIMDVLNGKPTKNIQTNYEEDLAKNNLDKSINNKSVSLKSENFRDTFEHFSDNEYNSNEISAYDNNSYSYI